MATHKIFQYGLSLWNKKILKDSAKRKGRFGVSGIAIGPFAQQNPSAILEFSCISQLDQHPVNLVWLFLDIFQK